MRSSPLSLEPLVFASSLPFRPSKELQEHPGRGGFADPKPEPGGADSTSAPRLAVRCVAALLGKLLILPVSGHTRSLVGSAWKR